MIQGVDSERYLVAQYFEAEEGDVQQCEASDAVDCLLYDGPPISYASRSLAVTDRNYAQCEMMTIVSGMEM